MFRGGEYYDDPKFTYPTYQVKNNLDVTVSTINNDTSYFDYSHFKWRNDNCCRTFLVLSPGVSPM